jgi:hypothetical protein
LATGARFTFVTVMYVVAESVIAFDAMKTTG